MILKQRDQKHTRSSLKCFWHYRILENYSSTLKLITNLNIFKMILIIDILIEIIQLSHLKVHEKGYLIDFENPRTIQSLLSIQLEIITSYFPVYRIKVSNIVRSIT